MAMLAEPRQKKRYNLVPRGKALYEDDSRYGTKMLEKMGWSKGKGLGVNLEGSKDFVRVRYKNDAQGLGFEERDDHWTQHEESFSGLLRKLNGDNEENDKLDNTDEERPTIGFGFQEKLKNEKNVAYKEKISGVSLEEKSKNSKARVHYKKFTKGKDLTQYSEKDLANIFGKKVGQEQRQADSIYQQLVAINESDNTNVKNNETITKDIEDKFTNSQTYSSGVSVNDYFKQKMEALKNKRKSQQEQMELEEQDSIQEEKKKKKGEAENVESSEIVIEEVAVKKKKKSKKNKENINEAEEILPGETTTEAAESEPPAAAKKKKNKKCKEKSLKKQDSEIVVEKSKAQNEDTETVTEENSTESMPEKKKKCKKSKEKLGKENLKDFEIDLTLHAEYATTDQMVKKKKLKKSKRNAEEQSIEKHLPINDFENSSTVSKSHKKRAEKERINNFDTEKEEIKHPSEQLKFDNQLDTLYKKKKNKKVEKLLDSIQESPQKSQDLEKNVKMKNKKRKIESAADIKSTDFLESHTISKDSEAKIPHKNKTRKNMEILAADNKSKAFSDSPNDSCQKSIDAKEKVSSKSKKRKNIEITAADNKSGTSLKSSEDSCQKSVDAVEKASFKCKKRKNIEITAGDNKSETSLESPEDSCQKSVNAPSKRKKRNNIEIIAADNKSKTFLESPEDSCQKSVDFLEKASSKSKKRKNVETDADITSKVKSKETATEAKVIDSFLNNSSTAEKLEKIVNSIEDEVDSAKNRIASLTQRRYLTNSELDAKVESLNAITISTYHAEKFSYTDLSAFSGSNMSSIVGYGCDENVKLNIIKSKNDTQRIARLWNPILNEENETEAKDLRSRYFQYVKKIRIARKENLKVKPRLQLKCLKRKTIFTGI